MEIVQSCCTVSTITKIGLKRLVDLLWYFVLDKSYKKVGEKLQLPQQNEGSIKNTTEI